MKNLLSLIAFSYLISSCSLFNEEQEAGTSGYDTSHYLGPVVRPSTINTEYFQWDSINQLSVGEFNSRFNNGLIYLFEDELVEIVSYEQGKSFYALFGDTLFTKTSAFSFDQPVFYDTIESINIYVNRAYDTEHLENSNVNDLFDITYANPIPFVLNGYSYKGLDYPYTSASVARHDCMKEGLIEFNKRINKVGICTKQNLELNQAPVATDTFQFRIVYTFANDKTYETTTPNAILIGE